MTFLDFSSTGLAGLIRGGATGLGMAMATDGTTTGVTWDIMATLASTGDQWTSSSMMKKFYIKIGQTRRPCYSHYNLSLKT